ncbi:replication-associated recombination protein A [Dasania sp. GY-MA-18]|uniref:Replication-associated recombination protein A n=1 Tax=Dasania phycosphaerae TaxID=2950436 RepID=A0A9J6RIS9_9GAMM|nr:MULTISPECIES: replication-associated recombination protein A [Dasania]MCR8921837.1 replication-associated recombination protein A [Dasania sp. GY-MA-18]MCZ0864265.1 replication-associated recombination protein A [Dasania phycosphaerae]MCZ0867993.1 replication-associated recombination protein A [Dasania phycosphaerae]
MSADLFSQQPVYQPLAAKLRPTQLDHYIGQEHLLSKGKPLCEALDSGQMHSMILWGPPGVGKTSLAKLIAKLCKAHFITISAVLSGVKEIRAAVDQAKQYQAQQKQTILFIDEVHRFNKSQQDAFLPYVEDGTFLFIGATTENPSFELNNALLSRTRVYKLRELSESAISDILSRGIASLPGVEIAPAQLARLAQAADGDARRALNLLELAAELAAGESITTAVLDEVLEGYVRRFDKGGDLFYEQISALHKSVRGSSPDGALYWFCRMIDGGCDPFYIARRVVRMASEDIGNADPRALEIALNAWDVQQRLGSPEGELAIAQAVVYLASAAKSNAVYSAYNQVMADIKSQPSYEVPVHLRNAPTSLMKDMDYGAEYRYAHDEPNGYAAGENYLPEALKDQRYYQPVPRGLELKIAEKLNNLRELDKTSRIRRYPEP